MAQQRVTTVHVVSQEGEAIGVVTLQDICRILVTAETRQKGLESERLARAENAAAMKMRATNASSSAAAAAAATTTKKRTTSVG